MWGEESEKVRYIIIQQRRRASVWRSFFLSTTTSYTCSFSLKALMCGRIADISLLKAIINAPRKKSHRHRHDYAQTMKTKKHTSSLSYLCRGTQNNERKGYRTTEEKEPAGMIMPSHTSSLGIFMLRITEKSKKRTADMIMPGRRTAQNSLRVPRQQAAH